jgi:DNA polymerase I
MTKYMSFDTETTGFNIYHGARPFLFIGSKMDSNEQLKTLCTEDGERFRKALEDPDIIKIMHNAKFDILMMKAIGIEVKGKVYDTMIAAHLLDENNSCSLDYCSKTYLDQRKQGDKINEWFIENKIKKADRNYADVPMEIMEPYAIADAELTYKLFFILEPMLKAQDLWELFEQECNLINVLVDMFCEGVKIDVPYFEKLKVDYLKKAEQLRQDIYMEAGCEFDILSTKQLANILLNAGINLPLTEKGNPSANKKVLEKIDHPLVKHILDYRHTMKFISAFIDNMLKHNIDGVIHSELWGQGTVTGRFSSSNPNMQQVPKEDDSIRRGFICDEDYYNFYFDYAQQEYRVFLDYIKEEEMVRKVNEEKADFHDLVFAEMGEYTKTRRKTKTLNFMLIYGGGVNTLAEMLGVSWNEANEIKNKYFEKFTKVKPFLDLVNQTVKWKGFVKNRFNRRRRLRSSEGYKAPNSIIQGGCADYIKNRMIVVHEFLLPYKSELVLQIHDELVIKIHKDELHVVPKIKNIMERCHNWFKVNLDVDVSIAMTNWADAVDYVESEHV